MLVLKWANPIRPPNFTPPALPCYFTSAAPFSAAQLSQKRCGSRKISISMLKLGKTQKLNAQTSEIEIGEDGYEDEEDEEEEEEEEEEEDEFELPSGFKGREDEGKYDKDPEFGHIIGDFVDDPEKAQSKIEERFRKKRNKILHTKTGSGTPMKVIFNKFEFSNSHIWFEFYNAPLEKDVSLLCTIIRSWHIVGRLGGLNSMNMQLTWSDMEKRPSYDAIQGANVDPTTFYNIGDLEVQDNIARVWVDIGTSEPLLLDVLVNALTQFSNDVVGIKQVVFGGSEFQNWKENATTDDAGYSVHRI